MKYYLICILAILCFTLGCTQPAAQSGGPAIHPDELLDGSSLENAIIISGVGNGQGCSEKEYLYLAEHLGERGVEWVPMSQEQIEKDGRIYDLFRVQFRNLTQEGFYFDITDCIK